jgi:type III secretion protein R
MDLTEFSPASALVTVILIALAPFVAVMVTSFTKIVVTLSLLRNALGLQQTPPNIVLNGLALILTIYVMYPVFLEMGDIIGPRLEDAGETAAIMAIADDAKEPLRDFLIRHSDEAQRQFFLGTMERIVSDPGRTFSEGDFVVVVPAFTVSELTKAFQIGFLIFLPFLVIDLVVANILLAMGMMMLSPTIVSLPFKLLLFVIIDGWVKLSHGLVLSYA